MACGGGGGSSTPSPAPPIADNGDSGSDGSEDTGESAPCDVPLQIEFVEEVTDSWYLWYDEMAEVEHHLILNLIHARLKCREIGQGRLV